MMGLKWAMMMAQRMQQERGVPTLQQRALEGVQNSKGGMLGMVGPILRRRKATGSAGNAGRTMLGGD